MSIEHKLIWSIVFFILFSLAVYVYTARASEYSDAVGFFFCYLIYNMFKNIARGEGGERIIHPLQHQGSTVARSSQADRLQILLYVPTYYSVV